MPNHDQGPKVWWRPGDHFLLKYTSENNASCTRAYTPIKLKQYALSQDRVLDRPTTAAPVWDEPVTSIVDSR
ncbi:jg8840 [Pararge aegeria aegeria]|uniref:Jg8840 protein n=1 Tax=Pararge aegeria aegeria TaxID=348720 RepID=A0A8S4SLA2_9NEOP|nr:jg8840 [Pararge aegeria aegeria]